MIYGIGCDLCSISRLEKSLSGTHSARFIQRVFGPQERTVLALDSCQPGQCLSAHRLASAAADFAAKEAFLKAAGTGLREPFALVEIQVLRQASGAPVYAFSGQSALWVAQKGLTAHLTLSHEGDMAMAVCLLEQTAP